MDADHPDTGFFLHAGSHLLVIGATSLLRYWRGKLGAEAAWVNRLLERRPPRLVTVALANKLARIVWAVLVRGETYRRPSAAAA